MIPAGSITPVNPKELTWLASPSTLAMRLTEGRWKPARHLTFVEDKILASLRSRQTAILLFEAPPRHGKSELISKWLTAWYLLRNPHNRAIVASYADKLARHWGRSAKRIAEQCGHRIGLRVADDVTAANEWEWKGLGGGMLTAGVGGPLTGRGANLMVIDDPVKNPKEAISETFQRSVWHWFQSVAFTRLEPGGTMVVMMTRWHENDLIGQIVRAANDLGVRVERYSMPAIAEPGDVLGRAEGEPLWPERWPLEALLTRRAALEAYWWYALYQQRPTQFGETAWPEEYFAEPFWATDLSWPKHFDFSVMACDPSKGVAKGDPSALIWLGVAGGLMHVDADIKRRPVSQIVADGIGMWRRLGCDRFGIEANHFQELLGVEFERTCKELNLPMPPVSLIHNDADKIRIRIPRIGPYLHRHKMRFRNNAGTRILVRQLRDFPFGAHDDGPDGLEMTIRLAIHLSHNRAAGEPAEESVYA